MWRRIWALIAKELMAVLKDRKSRIVIVGIPLVQLLIFPHAATFEVTNVRLAVFNEDGGTASRNLVAAFAAASPFQSVATITSDFALREIIESGRAEIALRIGEDFSANLAAGRPAQIQAIVDGRNSNTALIILNYTQSIVGRFGVEPASENAIRLIERAFYNPNLLSLWFILPGLVGILVLVVTLSITAFSVARERETGTFEQLLVTPLRPYEIAIGKTVPALLIGFTESLAFILITTYAYGVPLVGNLGFLLIGMVAFLMSVVGIGLSISAISRTQQQALFGGFFFIVPSVILSGFATPIYNMPQWIQAITYLNPLRYFIVISRGLFLKDIPIEVVMAQLWPMVMIAAVTLVSAGILFRRRLY